MLRICKKKIFYFPQVWQQLSIGDTEGSEQKAWRKVSPKFLSEGKVQMLKVLQGTGTRWNWAVCAQWKLEKKVLQRRR